MSLLLDTAETARLFADGRTKTSWSKWKTVNLCPARWFGENFAVWVESRSAIQDGLYSIPGSLVQRVWESFINDRVYHTLPSTQDAWLGWLDNATQHLYRLLVKPLEAQYQLPYVDSLRTFFRTKAGKLQLEAAIAAGLPQNFRTDLKLQFVNPDDFKRVYGSEDKFFAQLRDTYTKTLTLFAQYNVNLDAILSEEYVEVKLFDKIIANGGVDFLVQPGIPKTPFSDIKQLSDGYTLLDGKIRFGKTLDQEQLFYYAAIIQLKYRRTARYVGFINWSEGKFAFYEYLPAYAHNLQTKLRQLYDHYTPLEQTLKAATQPTIDLVDLPYLKFTPSKTNCAYCNLAGRCQAAQKAGITLRPRDTTPPTPTTPLDLTGITITEDLGTTLTISTDTTSNEQHL